MKFATWAYNFSQDERYQYFDYNTSDSIRVPSLLEIERKYDRANNYLPPPDSYYTIDCVGWVAAAMFMFYNIKRSDYTTAGVFPYSPQNQDWNIVRDTTNEPLIAGELIRTCSSAGAHVAIWIGPVEGRDGTWVVECAGSRHGGNATRVRFSQYTLNGNGNPVDNQGRIYTGKARVRVDRVDQTQLAPVQGGGPIGGSIGFSNIIMDDFTVDLDNLEFDFTGNPTGVSITGRTESEKGIFDFIKQFLNYILGIMFSVIKISILGWTNIIENIINDVLIAAGGNG